jgi:FkbH-like protein
LEARKILREFQGGEALPFLLALSGTAEPLELYLTAAAALRSRDLKLRSLPFGTLAQHLRQPSSPESGEVLLLLPWDFAPDADWRSGVSPEAREPAEIERGIEAMGKLLLARRGRPMFYLPAPFLPLAADPGKNAALGARIQAEALHAGTRLLPPDAFSLATYLNSGCPVGGTHLGQVALELVSAVLDVATAPKKVLVTDFDDVLWSGVVAEEGVGGIAMGPEGKGYRHFIYQSLLLRLRREGVLIAGVTRNSPEIVAEVFAQGNMPLAESDFVAILASYGAKSSQIRQLGERLNLGLDSFVFVDDNPIEVGEVSSQLPEVIVRRFPDRDELLPELVANLVADFHSDVVTAEDRDRTELYRRRLEGIAPSQLSGGDLSGFLRDLGMTLTIQERSTGDRARVVQLINKTNQFNLNGRRLDDADIGAVLAAGGRLYGASLSDRSGSHGEILACLTDAGGTVRAFVMSCRVFQRRVEYAFLAWICSQPSPPTRLDFTETPRNEPFRMFLADPAFSPADDGLQLDPARFREQHAASLELFAIESREPAL